MLDEMKNAVSKFKSVNVYVWVPAIVLSLSDAMCNFEGYIVLVRKKGHEW